jgi:hypothetical protein
MRYKASLPEPLDAILMVPIGHSDKRDAQELSQFGNMLYKSINTGTAD